MRTKILIINIIILITFIPYLFSKEVDFETSNMEVLENGNIIFAYDSTAKIPLKKVKIISDKAKYDKIKNFFIFTGNVKFYDNENNLVVRSDEVTYDQNEDLIHCIKDTIISFENGYTINSKNIFFNRKSNLIYGDQETTIQDNDQNFYILNDKFNLNTKNEIIKSKSAIVIDNNQNKYFFKDLIINTKIKEIVGKEIKVEFKKSYFGNENNDPILKGKGGYSNDKELKVYKAVFSTCNIENKDCRGWELSTEEFNHDKEKKIYEYKNSWLKIFDYKVFFMPYFNHPDPTIKRKSGFLTPSYSSSESLGTSIIFPYFKIISSDKDMTFSPRYYADKSFLFQNEYRQALKNSYVLSDFSFLIGEAGTKSHFFYNQLGDFNQNISYKLNIQDVKGDNYLKKYKLLNTSPLITNDNILLSNFDVNWRFNNANLKSSFRMYEDLSRNYHDRYQYIFPDFSFVKNINIPKNYNGSLIFNADGYNKNYNTNITESVLINNVLFKSDNFINQKGLLTNYNLLLKNANSYSNNSPNLKENEDYDLYQALKFDLSLPLRKKFETYTNYLKPRVSILYSPNGNNDISTKELTLNYNNLFNLNRISTNSQVEGGESISIGLEFQRENAEVGRVFDARVGNVIKPKENIKLPTKSKLNKKRSDVFGDINYKVNQNLNLGYTFSYDKDLKYSNLDVINLGFNVNNFFTNFNYFTEDHDFGDTENLTNSSTIKINDETKFIFSTAENLRENFTQYYNLIYSYNTDCLAINFNYNKSFYSDGSLEPDETLSFLIKIIPFTELGVPNFGNIIGK